MNIENEQRQRIRFLCRCSFYIFPGRISGGKCAAIREA
jgi:hypothetical protein